MYLIIGRLNKNSKKIKIEYVEDERDLQGFLLHRDFKDMIFRNEEQFLNILNEEEKDQWWKGEVVVLRVAVLSPVTLDRLKNLPEQGALELQKELGIPEQHKLPWENKLRGTY